MSLLLALNKISILRNIQGIAAPAAQTFRSMRDIALEYKSNPTQLFTDPETQKLLKSMTQLDVAKLFRRRTTEDNTMKYKFMTTEELEETIRNTLKKCQKRLQMVPIVSVKEDKPHVISKDDALKDFSNSKYVITDITFGLSYSARKVIVRQTDGTLEYAPMEMAKRMKQIYFPLKGRKLRLPRMFQDEDLKRCLDEQKYEFLLDRLIVQFEPYEKEFHSLSSEIYQHLNETKQFHVLRSTRHFGPMAFFFAWHRCIDDLLYDMIKRDFLKNGVELISLMYKIHSIGEDYSSLLKKIDVLLPDPKEMAVQELLKPALKNKEDIKDQITNAIGKTKESFEADQLCLEFIEKYIANHALKKVQLELALQTLKESNREKRLLFDGLNKAHGVYTNN